MEKIAKKDFIEIEFTGKDKDGNIFDSNIKEDLAKANLNTPAKPFIYAVDEDMFLKSVDDFLIGKETGKDYELELEPEKAFGKRNPQMIKMVPLRIFKQQQQPPYPGMMFNFDGQIGKIISVSGGRILTDFNNPLAGKTVIYKIKVKRKVTELKEKASAMIQFFVKKELPLEIKEKKLIIEADPKFAQFFNLFKDKFKELLDLEIEVVDKIEKEDFEKKTAKTETVKKVNK